MPVTQRIDMGAGREVRAEDGRYVIECSRCGYFRDSHDDGTPIMFRPEAEGYAEDHDTMDCEDAQQQTHAEAILARYEEEGYR